MQLIVRTGIQQMKEMMWANEATSRKARKPSASVPRHLLGFRA
jgi:hypothetical protein